MEELAAAFSTFTVVEIWFLEINTLFGQKNWRNFDVSAIISRLRRHIDYIRRLLYVIKQFYHLLVYYSMYIMCTQIKMKKTASMKRLEMW